IREKISREIHLSTAFAPNTQQRKSNYENIYPSYRNGCHGWLEFMRVGGAGHDHHDSRDYHGSTTGDDAADNNYPQLRLLVAILGLQGARAEWLRALFLNRWSL